MTLRYATKLWYILFILRKLQNSNFNTIEMRFVNGCGVLLGDLEPVGYNNVIEVVDRTLDEVVLCNTHGQSR